MAPKKQPAASAAPLLSSSAAPTQERNTDALSVRKGAAHPSTAVMVKEALKALDSRKGVSSQAIQNHIKQKYPSVDVARLKHLVRRALKKGLESGTLVRPANYNVVTTGATGKFRLAAKVKEPKLKMENADPNVQRDSKEKDEAKKVPRAGAKKKEATKEDGDPQEDTKTKPLKRPKKDEAAGPSKLAPVKKPQGKKAEKRKEPAASTGPKTAEAGRATRHQAAKKGSEAAAAAKAPGRGGKKGAR